MNKIESPEIQQFIEENLPKEFFKENLIQERSAYAILDFTIHVDADKIDFTKILPPEEIEVINKEVEEVKQENDLDKLYNRLRKEASAQAVDVIIEKFIAEEDSMSEKFLNDMKRTGNDFFAESAARFFIRAKKNYANEISEIIEIARYPYTQAILCYILGEIGEEKHIPVLYKYYKMLKGDYKRENFYEGPLFALHQMKRRYKF